MDECVIHAVDKLGATLHSDVHLLADGHPTSNQAHCTLRGLELSYESTYQEVHKANFEQLRGLLHTPEPYTFMHMDLMWATQVGAKGRRHGSTTHAPVSVAYIPWARVHDFVKGEEAHN